MQREERGEEVMKDGWQRLQGSEKRKEGRDRESDGGEGRSGGGGGGGLVEEKSAEDNDGWK